MGSPLDYVSSEKFRKDLMKVNLAPYPKSPYKQTPPITYEIVQSDYAVQDSPDNLIDDPDFANKLYPLNQYGSEGGYKQVPDPGALLGTKSNEGEYGPQDAKILNEGYAQAKEWQKINPYGNPQNLIDSAEAFSTLDPLIINGGRGTNAQPYPTTFVSSYYSPVSILLSKDPRGSDGLLSQDSFIAKLGAQLLRKGFEDRIGREIIQRTTARANIFNADSGTDILNLITGRVPLIEPNFTITVPSNAILSATDFALRLAGSTVPASLIPGSYFDPSINPRKSTTIQQLNLAFKKTGVGKFFNRLLGGTQTGSQLFLNNTGAGQKSRLFDTLNYNTYKPGYTRGAFDRLLGAIVGTAERNSNYYVGSVTSEPSQMFSPSGEIPVNSAGVEQQAPVYGPQELAQLYEGPDKDIKLGANGPTYSDGGGIEGGFTWVSPKYKDNAGKRVGIGGLIVSSDEDFKPSSFNKTESTNPSIAPFKDGSILDDTQRIIDSQPQGGKRLKHVGNAIDQVSKVFHDGYRELTKGSKVLKYVGDLGQEKGTEYCRVFSKDIPYLQYNDLQKVDGMVSQGRKYSYSVLDNTYNLNIYPIKGETSTNLIGATPGTNAGYVKKYMFSLENLSWRTSNKPGFTWSDLPICERGPNDGRIMWFPPYDLKFTESVGASWKGTDFLGRPEPVYTYVNTNRTGTLSWKIVVDHPSVLNVIANRVLNNETNKERVNSMLESFFAGCLKYDLYQLAQNYPLINPNDLNVLQTAIDQKKITPEQYNQILENTQTGVDGNKNTSAASAATEKTPQNELDKFGNFSFYYDNSEPKNSDENYSVLYNSYLSKKPTYLEQNNSDEVVVDNFFSLVIEKNYNKINNDLINQIDKLLSNNDGTITINLVATKSTQELESKRLKNAENYFTNNPTLKKYIQGTTKRLVIKGSSAGQNSDTSQNMQWINGNFTFGNKYGCTEEISDNTNSTTNTYIYKPNAMACRRVYISSIQADLTPPKAPKNEVPNPASGSKSNNTTQSPAPPLTQPDLLTNKPSISKKVLRALLSECDYFEAIKEDTPMVYDNLKEKIKFFNPVFHSITPEGLNSRLTFLQQCLRPGDTIPVIKTQDFTQNFQYNNATNTAFGAPPVLVLRIGDFYNTKIIPDSLQLSFEGLDLNPEGIGVQPMIATVNLNFKFIGGSGLKNAVDRLQNSLSFNYYANTEMYDDRATPTDDSFIAIDQSFAFPVPPSENQVQNENQRRNGNTIGEIVESNITETGETGTMSYTKYMEGLKKQSQEYFTTVINKNREILKQYSSSIRQIATFNRNYTIGTFVDTGDVNQTPMYGKPYNIQTKIDKIFKELMDDVDNDVDGYIKFISNPTKDFSKKLIRTVKNNYKNFLTQKKSTFENSITTIIQDLSIIQQNYTMTLTKANVILLSGTIGYGTDGYQEANGKTKVFYIKFKDGMSDLPEYEELKNDLDKVDEDLKEFIQVCLQPQTFTKDSTSYESAIILGTESSGALLTIPSSRIFLPISKNEELNDNLNIQREYTILNQDIVNDTNYATFKDFLIGNIKNNERVIGTGSDYEELNLQTDAYWIQKIKKIFQEENQLNEQFINEMEKNHLIKFLKYTPYSEIKREFEYTFDPGDLSDKKNREDYIKFLGLTANDPKFPLNTWNDLTGSSLFKPKVKFN